MTRVLISVEGPTEEAFCRDVLGPHLSALGVYVTSVTLTTKRNADGSKFTGGVTGWDQIRHPNTAPSKRLIATWPGYVKTIDGPAIAREAGLALIRTACPHFGTWLGWLESLANQPT
jgi:hypothetical protein